MEYALIGLVIFAMIFLAKLIKIIPQRSAYIIERLGKYSKTLNAGFHVLVPFIDKVTYKHSLKETAIDVPPQTCITKDNISVNVNRTRLCLAHNLEIGEQQNIIHIKMYLLNPKLPMCYQEFTLPAF